MPDAYVRVFENKGSLKGKVKFGYLRVFSDLVYEHEYNRMSDTLHT